MLTKEETLLAKAVFTISVMCHPLLIGMATSLFFFCWPKKKSEAAKTTAAVTIVMVIAVIIMASLLLSCWVFWASCVVSSCWRFFFLCLGLSLVVFGWGWDPETMCSEMWVKVRLRLEWETKSLSQTLISHHQQKTPLKSIFIISEAILSSALLINSLQICRPIRWSRSGHLLGMWPMTNVCVWFSIHSIHRVSARSTPVWWHESRVVGFCKKLCYSCRGQCFINWLS